MRQDEFYFRIAGGSVCQCEICCRANAVKQKICYPGRDRREPACWELARMDEDDCSSAAKLDH